MTLKEIKDIKSENDNSLIRNLLSNQKILGEELLEEKKERLTRLEKELADAKVNFLANCSTSTSLVTTNSCYCNYCGHNHTPSSNNTDMVAISKKLNEHYLETALTCKQFLLRDEYNELAKELFDKSFEQIKTLNSAKNIFDLTEKIHKCKESIKILERNIADSESQEQKLEAKVEVLSK
ncbi:MAG: hypothetical protein GBAus27B_000554 [Mycoplasmataceae bacterium]|nr:MAG: hypothetical protein GBAus27B_000554 [Mycoplasmataceae bacterium]